MKTESTLKRLSRGLGNVFYFLAPLAAAIGLCILLAGGLGLCVAGMTGLGESGSGQQQSELNLFPTGKVLEVEITVDEEDWDTIRHQSRNLFEALEAKRKDGPVKGPYTWVRAKVKIDGEEFHEVGLRKKGFVGSQNTGRPSLKIKLNHIDGQAQINGLTMLTFNNNQQDTSLMSQTMGYALYNAAGSPAPRCGYARITLNGKNLGVYSHVESLRKPLLKRGFEDDRGVLYEGTVVDFFEGWDKAFEKKIGKDRLGREKINLLIDVLEQDDLPDVEQAIGKLVDLDSFYTFWAIEGLIGFWDGYTANNNNFFVYLNPQTGKFHFLPWGLDCAFEKYSKLPGTSRRAPLSVKTKGRVAYRLYQVKSCRERYAKTIEYILDNHWNEQKLIAEIDHRHAMLKPYLAREQVGKVRVEGIQNFIRNRRMDLTKEIAGGMPVWTARPDPPVILPNFMKIFQPKGQGGGGDIWALTKNGDLDGLKKSISKGTNVNGQNLLTGITPISMAALNGKTEVIEFLLNKGADVNARSRDGGTALHGAAFLGHIETVNLLLNKGANPNVRNKKGETPLDSSSGEWNDGLRGVIELVAGFMQIKVDMEDVKAGRPKVAATLRNQGGKLSIVLGNQSTGENNNPEKDIWTAAKNGNLAAVKTFLAKGIKINSPDPIGATPLSMAALTGEVETARFLINKGAEINVQHKDGATPLHFAAFFGETEVVELLLENNANINLQNNKGETPLDNASAEWSKVQFALGLVGGFFKIDVDMEAAKTGRMEAAIILRAKGGKRGSGLN
jgi:ankyrin repeat protein